MMAGVLYQMLPVILGRAQPVLAALVCLSRGHSRQIGGSFTAALERAGSGVETVLVIGDGAGFCDRPRLEPARQGRVLAEDFVNMMPAGPARRRPSSGASRARARAHLCADDAPLSTCAGRYVVIRAAADDDEAAAIA